MPLIWLILGLAVFGGIFYVLTVHYTDFVVKRLLERHHRDGEFVLATHRAPQSWSKSLRIRLLPDRRRKAQYLRRLASLKDYFRRTPMVESESMRDRLIRELETIRAEWKESSTDEIELPE